MSTEALTELRIHKLTRAQYNALTPSANQFYMITDETNTDAIISEKIQTLTNPTSISTSNGTIAKITLSANTTLSTLTANAGTTLTLIITNGGSYAITWPTIYWADGTAPTLTSSGVDMVTLFYDGTYWYGVVASGLATA